LRMGEMLRLRVVYGRENLDVDVASTSTAADLQAMLEPLSGLPASEQRLIHRGRVISRSAATSDASGGGVPAHLRSLGDLGVEHRDRLHLSADPKAAEDRHRREGQLRMVSEAALALDALEARIQASTTTPGAWDVDRDLRTYEELLTRQLLALDGIDGGSASSMDADARAQRKHQIARAERLSRHVQDHHAQALRSRAEDGLIESASDDDA